MSVPRPRREVPRDVLELQHEGRHAASELGLGHSDRDDLDLARQLGSDAGHEPALPAGEGQREGGVHRRTGGRFPVRRRPRRNVERDDGPGARVDQLDQARDEPLGRATRARAEERVDDDVRARQRLRGRALVLDAPRAHAGTLERAQHLGGVAADLALRKRQQDLRPRPPFLQPPRGDEAVAAVAALAADHRHPRIAPRLEILEQRTDLLGRAASRVLHQRGAGDAELVDRAAIEPPRLRGGEEGLHRRYRPAASAAAWTRKSARIAVYASRHSARAARGSSMWSPRSGSRRIPFFFAPEAA